MPHLRVSKGINPSFRLVALPILGFFVLQITVSFARQRVSTGVIPSFRLIALPFLGFLVQQGISFWQGTIPFARQIFE